MSTSVFNIPPSSSRSPKLHFSHVELSTRYLDPSQPPTKGLPFRHINEVPFVKGLKVCMPEWLWQELYAGSDQNRSSLNKSWMEMKYAKVRMSLADILDDVDLRRGNYSLLAASASLASNSTNISLYRGCLTIGMPQHVYQRSGLTFQTSQIANGGLKHDPKSARYVTHVDLRQPSMVKGKKAFDRLMHAAKFVEGLCEARVWLFADLNGSHSETAVTSTGKKRKRDTEQVQPQNPATDAQDQTELSARASTTIDTVIAASPQINSVHDTPHPLSKHNPTYHSSHHSTSLTPRVLIPASISNHIFLSTLHSTVTATRSSSQKGSLPTILEEDIHDLAEYLSLLFLGSDRITKAGYKAIDPYLCQYSLPEINIPQNGTVNPPDNDEEGFVNTAENVIVTDSSTNTNNPNVPLTKSTSEDIRTVTYSGFMPSDFVTRLVIEIISRSKSRSSKPRDKAKAASQPSISLPGPNSTHAEAPEAPGEKVKNSDVWIAINILPHETDGPSPTNQDVHRNGVMILLQGRNDSDDGGSDIIETQASDGPGLTEGDGMDIDVMTDDNAAGNRTAAATSSANPYALSYVTCFEFVDA